MKKLLFLSGLLFMLVLIGCSQRDMSTPSGRLVGHWVGLSQITKEDVEEEQKLLDMLGDTLSKPVLQEGIYEYHKYYGKVDSKTQIGSYIVVGETSTTARHQYKIISENPSEDWIIVKLLFSSGESRREKYQIAKDGMSLISETELELGLGMSVTSIDTLKYVDSKTNPQ
ncbi:hypothetical protein KAX97_12895 [candidate division WOR-3 bacterium]|nr:hypothetical protein [candidate division WOR-3 bacterium]